MLGSMQPLACWQQMLIQHILLHIWRQSPPRGTGQIDLHFKKFKSSEFNVHVSVHRNNILIYIQHDAMLHSLFYVETALHVSGGTSTHHQECIQLYLQHLVFVTPLLLPAAIAPGSSNGVTNTRCCRYSCMHSWWWVGVPSETCRAFSR